jgi:hypothetical protein
MGLTGVVLGRLVGAVRVAGAGVLAGLVAGAVVAGVGSRVVMKVVALVAGPDAHGALTANGNRVGDFTGDTLFLVAFGAALGSFGGLVYVALRPWLPGAGRGRGPLFGALLLGAFGTAVLEADNVDFRRFGSAPVNVALFGALFLLFGMLVASLADRAARLVPPVGGGRPRPLAAMAADAALLLGAVLGLFPVGMAVGVGLAGQGQVGAEFRRVLALFVAVMLSALLGRVLERVVGWRQRPLDAEGQRGPRIAGGAVAAVPLVVGLVLTARAVGAILVGA